MEIEDIRSAIRLELEPVKEQLAAQGKMLGELAKDVGDLKRDLRAVHKDVRGIKADRRPRGIARPRKVGG